MGKHTDGPWSLWGKSDPSQVISSVSGFIAQTIGGNDEANARLISAAPEMLEALQAFVDVYGVDDVKRWMKARDNAIEAISKALGE